jgi:hypothetical protein
MLAGARHWSRLFGPAGGGAFVGVVLALLAFAPVAAGQPDRSGTVTPDTPFTWTGPAAVGHADVQDESRAGWSSTSGWWSSSR